MTADALSVLLIEDNPNDAMLVERYLRNAETPLLPEAVSVRHEETLTAGVDALDDETDLLLLDLGLPESEGLETFERVDSQGVDVPVIVLTGLTDDQAAVEVLKRGAQDFLKKGNIDEERLVKSIRYALERQEQKSRLRTTNEQLEVLNRILRHDLRNDLQIQQFRAESLQRRLSESEIPDNVEDDLEKIVESNRHMVELTENSKEYLEFISGAQDVVTREPVRLDTLLETELSKARSIHDEVVFDGEDALPTVSVYANEMLTSVFRNLLNNAVTHSTRDTPEVRVTVDDGNETTRVTVADNGPGIPDEKKTAIFGKGELGLESPGTGIGLYLVYTLVTAFQGRVWVEDNDPNGSRFVVELETADTQPGWANGS